MEIKDIEQILKLLKDSDIAEFELEHQGTKLKLSRISKQQMLINTALMQQAVVGDSESGRLDLRYSSTGGSVPTTRQLEPPETPSNQVKVESPMVGTFYRRPGPDREPFVKEGDYVKKGDTLCIIEAMKLMNEIDAPCSGKIEKVLLTEGEVVEFGESLFLIVPDM